MGLKIAALHYGTKSCPDYVTSAWFAHVETLRDGVFKHHSDPERQVFGANVAIKKQKALNGCHHITAFRVSK